MRKIEMHITPPDLIPFIYMYPACVKNPKESEAVMTTLNVVFATLFRDRDLIEQICVVLLEALGSSPEEVHDVFNRYIDKLVNMGRITPIEP